MTTRRGLLVLGVVALAVAGPPSTTSAQDWRGPARLSGEVVDQDGNPIAGAKVELIHTSHEGGPTVTTDEKGRWAVAGLARGTWRVQVTAEGYAVAEGTVQAPRTTPFEAELVRAQPTGPPPDLVESLKAGDEAYKAEDYTAAREAYVKALSLWHLLETESEPGGGSEALVTLHRQLARCYREEENYEKALEHLQFVLDSDPSDESLRLLMAKEALRGNMVERAEELLAGVDDSAVDDPAVYYNIAVGYLNQAKMEPAIPYLTKTIAVDPTHVLGYHHRALAYFSLQRMDEAAADCQKVLELSPEGQHADTARALIQAIEQSRKSDPAQP
jgi:tetratricopeptide (TPR) repeat protein